MNNHEVRVLFVCMGNICRSPTAEGVFVHKVREAGLSERIRIDSAGTHAYHIGNPPDERTQRSALRRGYDLSTQRARKVEAQDFTRFDYVGDGCGQPVHTQNHACPSGGGAYAFGIVHGFCR